MNAVIDSQRRRHGPIDHRHGTALHGRPSVPIRRWQLRLVQQAAPRPLLTADTISHLIKFVQTPTTYHTVNVSRRKPYTYCKEWRHHMNVDRKSSAARRYVVAIWIGLSASLAGCGAAPDSGADPSDQAREAVNAASDSDADPAPLDEHDQKMDSSAFETLGQDVASGGAHVGHATWFFTDSLPGSCDKAMNDSGHFVAIGRAGLGHGAYSSTCGRHIHVCNERNGRCVKVQVTDACPTCSHTTDLDMTPGAFESIAKLGGGPISVRWYFLP